MFKHQFGRSLITLTAVSSLFAIQTACSSKSVQHEAANPAPVAAPAPAPAPAETSHSAPAADMHAPAQIPAANAAHGSGASHRHAGEVPAEKALGWLKNGNTRYLSGKLRKDGQSKKDREKLAKGQQPHSIVLSCADSRVPPEVVFDQKLGEIFVVRAAGQALDSATVGSIEYAVEHLGSNLIVVMGHSSCGAVKAAHGTFGGKDAGSPSLNNLVADIQPRIKDFQGHTLSKDALEEGWANVNGVAQDLYNRSEIVRSAVDSGSLKIQKGLYHLDSGKVEWH